MPKLLIENCPLTVTKVDEVTEEYLSQVTERAKSYVSAMGKPHPGWKPILVCEGLMQVGDIGNRNKRRYPTTLWERIITQPETRRRLDHREVIGEVDHPGDGETKGIRASHIVTDAWLKGNKVYWRWEVLNTPTGQVLAELLKAGAGVAGSTRGHGDTVKVEGDLEEVQDNYQWVTTDIVVNPSVIGSDYIAADVSKGVAKAEQALAASVMECTNLDGLQEYQEATQRILGELDQDTCNRVLGVIKKRIVSLTETTKTEDKHDDPVQQDDETAAIAQQVFSESAPDFDLQVKMVSSLEEATALATSLSEENAGLRRDVRVAQRAAKQAKYEAEQIKKAVQQVAGAADDRSKYMKELVYAGAKAQQRVQELEQEVQELRDLLDEQQTVDKQVTAYAAKQIAELLDPVVHGKAKRLAALCATKADVDNVVEVFAALQQAKAESVTREDNLTVDEAIAAAKAVLAEARARQQPRPHRERKPRQVVEETRRPAQRRAVSPQYSEVLGESVVGRFGEPSMPPNGARRGQAPDFAMQMIEKLSTRMSGIING